ncbi:MAG: hypothetical protein GTO02_19805, partial [Candidatus Dadabacteria bacterium]|nr:hypothetical protein [Candidatus Dadabacteria bacterium]NIQ16546.1 hypothetical protein [Candidatus Dadabacteria bacterium]
DFKIGKLSGNLINKLELTDVILTIEDQPFVTINKISTNYSLPLLISLISRGDIPLRNTRIDGLKINIVKDFNGIWNYDKIGDKKEKHIDTKHSISIFSKNNRIINSSLQISDLAKDESMEFNIVNESLFSANLIGINKKFEIDIRNLNFDYHPHNIQIRNLKTNLILAGSNCVFKNTKMFFNGISVIGQGIINNFEEPQFNLSAYFDDIGPKNFGKFNVYVKSNGKMHSLDNIDATMELSMINSYINERRIWTNLKPIKIKGTNAKIKGYVNTEFGNSFINGDFDFKRFVAGSGVNKVKFDIDFNDIKTDDLIEIFNYTTYTFKVGEDSKLDSNVIVDGYWSDKDNYNIHVLSDDLLITDKNVGNFNLQGNARFFKDKIDLDLKSNIENLNIQSVLKNFEINNNMFGNIDIVGEIPTSGNFFEKSDIRFDGDLNAIDLQGVTEISSSSKGQIKKGKVYLENIDIESDFLNLKVKSDGGKTDDVNCTYELYSKDLSILSKLSIRLPFSGSIKSSGTVIGNLLNPRIDIVANMENFSYKNDFFAESFKIKAKSFTNLKALDLLIDSKIKNAILYEKDIDLIKFDSKSLNQNLLTEIYFENNKNRILTSNLVLKNIDKQNKTIDISKLEILSNKKVLKNQKNILINFNSDKIELVDSNLSYDNGHIRSKGFIKDDIISFSADLAEIDQLLISDLLNFREKLTGKLSGKIKLDGTMDNPDFSANLSSKNLSYSNFYTDKFNIKLKGQNNNIYIDIKSSGKTNSKLNVSGSIKSDLNLKRLSENIGDGNLNLKINAKNYNIGFVKVFNSNINNIGGLFSSNLKIDGTFKKPKIKGKLNLQNINFRLVQLLNELFIDSTNITFDNYRVKIPKTTVSSEKGIAKVKGELDLSNYSYSGDVVLDKLFIKMPSVNANLSGNIKFEGIEYKTNLNGDIDIAKGQIFLNPEKVKNIKDVRFVGQYKDEFTLSQEGEKDYYTDNIKLDMAVTIPNGTWIRSKGINAEVEGDLKVKKDFGSDNIIQGNIDALRGHYIIFGKLFKIEEGTINFPGSSVLNPQLNINAFYKISDINVNINVQGTTNEPRLALSSDPVLEETDIISYLVFGTSSDNLGTEERIYAGEFATNFAAGEISELIGSKFGIDVLTIQGHEEGGLSNPQIQVGSYVTEDIYVGYERSTSYTKEDSSTFMTDKFRFEWKLNDKFSMESEVGGENSGADFFYNHDF